MKKLNILICAWMCMLLVCTACSTTAEESTYQVVEIENVSISISDVSPSGACVTIRDTNENSYVYGQWYKVEAEHDGKWYDIKPLSEHYGFTEEGWIVGESDELNFNANWSRLYGQLPAGRYRLLKEVKQQYIAVEFDIA